MDEMMALWIGWQLYKDKDPVQADSFEEAMEVVLENEMAGLGWLDEEGKFDPNLV